MTFFCENCGQKLPSDARFCENCGCRISYEKDDSDIVASCENNLSLFAERNWEGAWKALLSDGKYEACGIILTNTSDCPENLKDEFRRTVSEYISCKSQAGVCYCVLDMATQSVKNSLFGNSLSDVGFLVKVLKEICKIAAPKYLLILGDRSCIGSAKWENLLNDPDGDSDAFVDSDLPYVALNAESPFEGGSRAFCLDVGRIPSVAKNGFREACAYLKNAMNYEECTYSSSFALSAKEWETVSRVNFRNASPEFYTCPPFTLVEEMRQYQFDVLPNDNRHNLLCFNLHGSPTHHYWLSGDGTLAYSPKCLPNGNDIGYVLCTEACYGAKPIISEDGDQSILISALAGHCLGFVGSTQIAYGLPDVALLHGGSPCCADILIGEFATRVANGDSLGDAYMRALSAMTENRSTLKGEEIKTIASFGLYGDPSLRLIRGGNRKSAASQTESKSFHIPMPDVRRAVYTKLVAVSHQLSEIMNEAIAKFYNGMENVTPRYYAVSGYDGYKAACKKETSHTSDVLSIYFDKNGNIEEVYVSK